MRHFCPPLLGSSKSVYAGHYTDTQGADVLALYSTVWYSIVLVLYCTVLYSIVQYLLPVMVEYSGPYDG